MKRKADIDKENVNELVSLSKKILKLFYIIIVIGIILCGLVVANQLKIFSFIIGIMKVLSPFFIGFIIAWLCYPLHKYMTDKKVPKLISVLIIFVIVIGLVLGLFNVFIPIIYDQVNEFIKKIPSVISTFGDFVTKTFDKVEIPGFDMKQVKQNILATSSESLLNLTKQLPDSVVNIAKSIVSGIGVFAIGLVIGIYTLLSYDEIVTGFYNLIPRKHRDEYVNLLQRIGYNARKVVNGTLLVACMVFVCDTIGFALIGLDSAFLFGLFCGITDLIPYIGPYIGGAAAVIVGFTQGPVVGLGVLIIVFIVQMVENYVLQPIVMSKAMQLHPVAIIVGLLLFGHFFGIVGMIIATPCIAILKEIVIFINIKLREKAIKKDVA